MSRKSIILVVAVVLGLALVGTPLAMHVLRSPQVADARDTDSPLPWPLHALLKPFLGPRIVTRGPVEPDSPLGRLLHQAGDAERAGDDRKAVELYTEALADKTVDWALRGILLSDRAKAFERLGQYDKAEADWTARLAIEPALASDRADRGTFYIRRKAYDRALADFAAGARQFPNSGLFAFGEGQVHSARGEHDAAIASYTEAIRLEPAMTKIFLERGSAYNYVGRYQEARSDYENALALDDAAQPSKKMPKREAAMARLGRGYASLHLGDSAHAIEDFGQVLAVVPKASNALRWRGSAFEQRGDRERALADYRAALALVPDDAKLAEQIREYERNPASGADPGSRP